MPSYNISEKTKAALVSAAGELFAENDYRNVPVKRIAERAGVMPNAITYHFGGKEGLVRAVWSRVLEQWDIERMRTYYESHRALLDTRDGRRQLVGDIIDLLFGMLYREGQPVWVNIFLVRNCMNSHDKQFVARNVLEPAKTVLMELFAAVTGNADTDSARCWMLHIVSAAALFSANMSGVQNLRAGDPTNYSFYRRLQYTATNNALFGAGLL